MNALSCKYIHAIAKWKMYVVFLKVLQANQSVSLMQLLFGHIDLGNRTRCVLEMSEIVSLPFFVSPSPSLRDVVGPLELNMNDISTDTNNLIRTFRWNWLSRPFITYSSFPSQSRPTRRVWICSEMSSTSWKCTIFICGNELWAITAIRNSTYRSSLSGSSILLVTLTTVLAKCCCLFTCPTWRRMLNAFSSQTFLFHLQ